jgi:16S rRNA (cytidine1402-2'-O)-methyltransferase
VDGDRTTSGSGGAGRGRGRLVVVATPIGNLSDLSPRAASALASADVVAAEDTRRTRVLLDHAGARVPMVSYHEHNEERRGQELLDRMERGEVIALVSDAGTPGVADPGFRLVRAAAARGLVVEAVPGPVAAVAALVVSGLPTDRFAFEGFLPRKPSARRARLERLASEDRTLVFYVTPHRAAGDLAALAEAFGDREAVVARELTKMHEEVWRGTLGELAARAAAGVRGELTVVVAAAPEQLAEPPDDAALVSRVRELLATGATKKEALARVATSAGVSRRQVYQAVLDAERGA